MTCTEEKNISYEFPLLLFCKASDLRVFKTLVHSALLTSPVAAFTVTLPSSCGPSCSP